MRLLLVAKCQMSGIGATIRGALKVGWTTNSVVQEIPCDGWGRGGEEAGRGASGSHL